MSYKYRALKTQEEIDTFFGKVCNQMRELRNNDDFILDWYKKDGIKIYGYFYNDGLNLICYGQTISPEEVNQQERSGIFAALPMYGSSQRYLGLKDICGNTLLSNNYEEINFFYETGVSSYFIVKSKGKVGVVRYSINSIDIIVPAKYDAIFDACEYTWGYVVDGNVGFMNILGRKITEAKYMFHDDFNIFIDGKALTQLNRPNTCKVYIDHYGNVIDFYYEEESAFSGNGTGCYTSGDLLDGLDAYEGDCSNLWNTD